MEVRNFQRVVVGSGYPAILTISPICGHEGSGILATFSVYNIENGLKRVELRHKDESYALFLFRYTDTALPDWWQSSEIVWALEASDED